MEKLDIEKENIVSDEDIQKVEKDIEVYKNRKNSINDNSTPLSIQKETISNLVQICYLELNKDRLKLISNFQKKNDHGFFSIKSANEELQKLSSNLSLVYQLTYLLDFSYFNYNSLNYIIIEDMKKVNYIIQCLINEISDDKYYKFIKDSLVKTNKNFDYNCSNVLKKEYIRLDEDLKNITRTNQELMTKHIISKNLFDMIKEYVDMFDTSITEEISDNITNDIKKEYEEPENNEYYYRIKKLESIELNYNDIDDKYRRAIKKFNYDDSYNILEKLKILSITKKYIIETMNKQKNILKSLSKSSLFYAYLKYLDELKVQIDEHISELNEELNNNNLSDYIDLFDLINSLTTYNTEIKSYEDKISKTSENTEIISYNNKITALSIKKRRVDINLLKNRYFDSSKIDNNVDISKSKDNSFELTSNIDDEIRACNEELSKCFNKLDITIVNSIYKDYKDNNLENTIDFIEYLIIKNNYMGAKLYTLKGKLLDLVYSKYIQSDMEVSFTDYILSNPVLNVDTIISNEEIIEFEKSKVKCKTKEKNIK